MKWQKCLELMKQKEKLEHDLPEVQRNLENPIVLIATVNNVEGLNGL